MRSAKHRRRWIDAKQSGSRCCGGHASQWPAPPMTLPSPTRPVVPAMRKTRFVTGCKVTPEMGTWVDGAPGRSAYFVSARRSAWSLTTPRLPDPAPNGFRATPQVFCNPPPGCSRSMLCGAPWTRLLAPAVAVPTMRPRHRPIRKAGAADPTRPALAEQRRAPRAKLGRRACAHRLLTAPPRRRRASRNRAFDMMRRAGAAAVCTVDPALADNAGHALVQHATDRPVGTRPAHAG
jgi:hypothetical protein